MAHSAKSSIDTRPDLVTEIKVLPTVTTFEPRRTLAGVVKETVVTHPAVEAGGRVTVVHVQVAVVAVETGEAVAGVAECTGRGGYVCVC